VENEAIVEALLALRQPGGENAGWVNALERCQLAALRVGNRLTLGAQ
jgi:hypothetical protein